MTTSHAQDDAFHEIQLNGKQLVFLFMAATVVSVVIFLCGVLVGRGVRAERGGMVADAGVGTPPEAPARQTVASPPAGSDPTVAQPPAAADELSYFNRLEKTNPPAEELKPAPPEKPAGKPGEKLAEKPALADKIAPAERPAEKTAKAVAPQVTPPAAPPVAPRGPAAKEVPAVASSAPAPTGPGYAVQVAALNVRGEADAIARRLSSKGYAAYVLDPANGTPQVYRVRVGKFGSRHEADTVAAKLQKEEQFKPWVTR